MTRKNLRIRAYAKINLNLRILGLRRDGMHELRTILQTIDLYDTLTFTQRLGPFKLLSANSEIPTDKTNLIWRAAKSIVSGPGRGGDRLNNLSVSLIKRIPLQAGLGGGSADAAATLIVLDRLRKLKTRSEMLHTLAADLGADVPFFLVGGTAVGLGRGDEIYPLIDLPKYWVVLLIPPFGVSTGDAYNWYDSAKSQSHRRSSGVLPLGNSALAHVVTMVNDLEAPVVERFESIGKMKMALEQAGAMAAGMSGSGSSVFGLFRSFARAKKAATGLATSGQHVILTRILSRNEYIRRSAVRVV